MTLSRRKSKYKPRAATGGPATSAMIASLEAEGYDTVAAPFGHALVEIAKTNPRIVGLTADLSKYTDLHVFAAAFPDRFFQMGMAEQSMVSAAAGLAREGFTPFATTYAVFASRRAYDFICMAIAEEALPVKIVCALPGLTTGYGPSHQATEDLAIFRGLPNLTIIDPCDATEIVQATGAIAASPGPVYMRLLRGHVPDVLGPLRYQFQMGKAQFVRRGGDATIVSTGFMTMRALDAAKALASEGIEISILHSPTIKPLDEETILKAAADAKLLVTAENHTIIGGLGETIAGACMRGGVHPRFHQIALPDEFLDAGALPALHDQYRISVKAMVEQIRGWLT